MLPLSGASRRVLHLFLSCPGSYDSVHILVACVPAVPGSVGSEDPLHIMPSQVSYCLGPPSRGPSHWQLSVSCTTSLYCELYTMNKFLLFTSLFPIFTLLIMPGPDFKQPRYTWMRLRTPEASLTGAQPLKCIPLLSFTMCLSWISTQKTNVEMDGANNNIE